MIGGAGFGAFILRGPFFEIGKGTPQYKYQKALKTACFQGFLVFILRGPLFSSVA
jgi:hypothetical protein